ALERLEHPRRVLSLEHRVAERRRELLQHRAAGEEPQLLRSEFGQTFEPQVVGDEAVVSAEGVEEVGTAVAVVKRARGKVEAGGPSFRLAEELELLRKTEGWAAGL